MGRHLYVFSDRPQGSLSGITAPCIVRGHEENTVALVAFWGALCLHTAITEISIRKGVNFGIHRRLRMPRLSLTRTLSLCSYFVIAIVIHVIKWTQLVADLKAGKKRNDGSSSRQSIGLDEEDEDVVVENGRATVPKDNWQVMGNKWEKARASRDAAATKMSSTWMGIFSVRENKKEERYKLMLDAQKERMDWDRKTAEKKLEIEREKIELEKQEAAIKWEHEKAKTFGEIELEKERLQIAWDAEDAKIMLADESLLDEHAKKWLVEKKEINDRREYEAARTATAAAEHATRMQAEHATRMQAEQDARMASEQAAWMASGE